MELDLWTIAVVFGLTALTLLLTGPGMWSEKWGWGWFEKKKKKKTDADARADSQARERR